MWAVHSSKPYLKTIYEFSSILGLKNMQIVGQKAKAYQCAKVYCIYVLFILSILFHHLPSILTWEHFASMQMPITIHTII